MNNFPHLFEPIEIGKTTVKNRIFMPLFQLTWPIKDMLQMI